MNKDTLARNIVDAALGVIDGYEASSIAYEQKMYERLCDDLKEAVLRQLSVTVLEGVAQ